MQMPETIIKRTGEREPFDASKIRSAARKAFEAVGAKYTETALDYVTELVTDEIDSKRIVEIEDIQDTVERKLMQAGYHDVARAYIKYRYNRQLVRRQNTTDESILNLLGNRNPELAGENSNKDTTVAATQRDYIAGEVSRDMTRRLFLPPHLTAAHDDGVFHFHDSDYFVQQIFNCCLLNLGDMLDNGTCINKKRIDSPNTFRVACTVAGQIIGNIGSNQYGGQSIDTVHLGKYLRKSRDEFERRIRKNAAKNHVPDECLEGLVRDQLEDELQKELAAGVQTLQYQINTFMTTNGQAPFVTLFLYLRWDDPYLKENAMIIKEILEQRIKGIKNEDGVYTTPAFPKLVYVLDEFNCLNGGDYDWLTRLAVKCTSIRMYPDYISAKKMRENYQGNVFSPMGCRSFLAPWKDENGEYKFEGRFNQGVVSINLPQIGIIADGDEEKFWKLLDERLQLCFEALMERHKALLTMTSDVSPLHWQYGAIARLPAHTPIKPYLFGGYSSISLGYIGLYECTMAMKGCSHTKKKGFEFAMRVMQRLRKACDDWKAETDIGFALYGTPAESLCYRFARIDKQKFGSIPNITDKGYYTNSYHVDVREKIDLFKKFEFEDQFQPISSGGCISYAEIPNMRNNLSALETCVKFIYDNIQYAEFNTKDDVCGACGFRGEITVNPDGEWECPNCHNTDQRRMTIVRRTCGYLGENYWNRGKTKEIASRVEHL